MRKRRTLLWIIPTLALIWFVIFTAAEQIPKRVERAYQARISQGWTAALEEHGYDYRQSWVEGGTAIVADPQGRIWVLGLRGLHMFEGREWVSREGRYDDLAVDPEGRVWVLYRGQFGETRDHSLLFFDGRQWQQYKYQDLGLEKGIMRESEIEVGRDGRIWMKMDTFDTDLLLELIMQQDGSLTVSEPELAITDGAMGSIVADQEGNLWVDLGRHADDTATLVYEVAKFDGKSWQRVPDQGIELKAAHPIQFDEQGNAWLMQIGGDVLQYDGQEWTTIVDETNPPPAEDGRYDGFYVDRRGRLWIWGKASREHIDNDSLFLFDKGTWTVFTQENSGIAETGSNIFGVAVDDRDRLWVASSNSVHMIPVDEAKPAPEEEVIAHRQRLSWLSRVSGLNWFVPSILLLLWLAVARNAWPGVLLVLSLVSITIIYFGVQGFAVYAEGLLNPIVPATYGGILGGLLGGKVDQDRADRGRARLYLNIILAIAGLLLGFVLGIIPWFIVAMSH